MSTQLEVQEYLNDLLMTDRANLLFVYQTAIGSAEQPAPEQAATTLARHIANHQGNCPAGVLRWLRSPQNLSTFSLVPLIRLAGHYRDEQVAEPLTVILRQLSFVAAHPAAVRALAASKGVWASKVLTDMLWSAPVQQWHVREPAILRELGRLGRKSSITDLIRALDVPYDSPVRAAATALAQFDEDDVLNPLIEILRRVQSGEPDRRAAGAAEALGLLGDARAIPDLLRAARHSSARLAISAAVALARLGTADAVTHLLGLARNNDVSVRARAMSALAIATSHQDPPIPAEVTTLWRHGLRDSQPEVRSAAALAIGRVDYRPATPDVVGALQAEVSPLVRASMVRGLGLLSDPGAVDTLAGVLARDDVSVKIEALDALARYGDPDLANIIAPYRAASDRRVVEAAGKALRRLLHKLFAWPKPAEIEAPIVIDLYSLEGARERLLPPPPAPEQPGFWGRLFGARPAPPPPRPKPVGRLHMSPVAIAVELDPGLAQPGWQAGTIRVEKRFSITVTREPVNSTVTADGGDLGVRFTLRQRGQGSGAQFETVAVSLWCAPSGAVGSLPPKSERLPCLDPHTSDPFLAAVRWYAQVHGERIEGLSISS